MEWSALRDLGTEPDSEGEKNGLPLLEMVCTLSLCAVFHISPSARRILSLLLHFSDPADLENKSKSNLAHDVVLRPVLLAQANSKAPGR